MNVASTFGGLCGTLKFQYFVSDFNKLTELDAKCYGRWLLYV